QSRRSTTDRGRENVFGKTYQPKIGIFFPLKADALRPGKGLECRARALLAEIARDCAGEFFDRYRRAPEPETWRDGRKFRRNEGIRLQPFDWRRRPAQRETDIADDIEQQTPDNAMHQR